MLEESSVKQMTRQRKMLTITVLITSYPEGVQRVTGQLADTDYVDIPNHHCLSTHARKH